MCGLFGWNLKSFQPHKMIVVATVLSVENDNRGGDSWGYYAPRRDFLRKGVGSISMHVKPSELTKYKTLMAHTRKATTGAVNKDNAHPFRLAQIVGAHNGIINNHTMLNHKYQRNCDVDSQHIFCHIQDNISLSDISGYGTVEYVELNDRDKVYLGSFNNGDLSVAHVEDFGIIWSSDSRAIRKALTMAEFNFTEYTLVQGRLYVAKEGLLYNTKGKLDVDSPYYRKGGNSSGGYSGGSSGYHYTGNESSGSSKSTYNSNVSNNDDDFYYGYNHKNCGSSTATVSTTSKGKTEAPTECAYCYAQARHFQSGLNICRDCEGCKDCCVCPQDNRDEYDFSENDTGCTEYEL